MNTRYFCAICNTKPDQISHHKSHLQTQKHYENRQAYQKELQYFSIYKTCVPKDWLHNNEIKDIILHEYGNELTQENLHKMVVEKLDVIDKYYKFEANKVFCDIVNGKPTNVFVEPSYIYKKINGIDHLSDKNAFLEWCIECILQSKETIKVKEKKTDEGTKIAKCCQTCYPLLRDIRMNLANIDGSNDSILRYAYLLFQTFGLPFLAQCNTSPIYFHKLVEVETTTIMVNVDGYEKKMSSIDKVWVESNLDEYGCFQHFSYVEEEVIHQKFRDFLISFFKETADFSSNKDYEIVSKLLLDSEFKNIMKLCEFFFEHKKEIIQQYCKGY